MIGGKPVAYAENVTFVGSIKYSLHGWIPDFDKMVCTHYDDLFEPIRIERRLPGTEAMWVVDYRDSHVLEVNKSGLRIPSPDSEALEEEYRKWVAKTAFET